jgi:colanic acid/amylovoran biosynthesis protein
MQDQPLEGRLSDTAGVDLSHHVHIGQQQRETANKLIVAPCGGQEAERAARHRPRLWLRAAASGLRRDPLLRNSVYIMLSTGFMAAFGLIFWLLVAHFYTPSQVGIASTLISSMNFITYVALLGFNSSFVQLIPQSPRRNEQITAGFLFVAGTAIVVSIGYVLTVPHFAPRLGFLDSSPILSAAFVILTMGASVNLLTDSVFIAYRSAGVNLLVDGLIASSTQLALPVALLSLGAFGVYAAQGSAALLAMFLSVIILFVKFGYRPTFLMQRTYFAQHLSNAWGNYIGNVLNILPTVAVPLIVLNRLGSESAGYYYLSFMMATLLFTIAYAVSQSLLAEGSYDGATFDVLLKRATKIMLTIMVPSSIVFASAGPYILRIFGKSYAENTVSTLLIFGITGPVVGMYILASVTLQLLHRTRARIVANFIYFLVIVLLAYIGAPRGLPWVATAWLIGNAIAAIVMMLWLRRGHRPSRSSNQPHTLNAHSLSASSGSPLVFGHTRGNMKILVVNAFIREAVGDGALLGVLVSQLESAFPDSKIVVSSLEDPRSHPHFEGHVNIGSSRRYGASEEVIRIRRALRKILLSAIGLFWFRGHPGLYHCLARILPAEVRVEFDALEQADLVVSVGGGYLNGTKGLGGNLSVDSMLLPLRLAGRLTKPLICGPQSFGPLATAYQRRAVKHVLGRADLVLVREDVSLQLLAELGLSSDHIQRGVDSAFAFASERWAGWRTRLGLPADDIVVGLTARQWLNRQEQEAYERKLAYFIDHVQRNPHQHIVLIPQVISSLVGEDDRRVNRRIANYCSGRAPRLIETIHDFREMKSLYQELDFTVGMRFHSVIFALTSMVPAIAIEYHHKAVGIMADLGLSRWVVPIESLDSESLVARFEDLVHSRSAYKRHLESVLPDYIQRAKDAAVAFKEAYASHGHCQPKGIKD